MDMLWEGLILASEVEGAARIDLWSTEEIFGRGGIVYAYLRLVSRSKWNVVSKELGIGWRGGTLYWVWDCLY